MPLPNPNYTINFTDPTKTSFIIPAFRTDGPIAPATPTLDVDASASHTSLLLFGKGHPLYGERTDQNLVNMIEHFANKTRPAFPIEGQIWFKNSSFTDPANPIDPSNAGLYVFSPLNFAILSADGTTHFVLAPSTLGLGQNILDIANYFSTGNTFVVFGTSSNDGTYNVVAAVPVGANIQITVASVPAFQGVGGNVQASKWNTIQLSGAPVGNLDMGGFKIINLGTPTNPNDATNKAYVDAQDALHVLKAGDTMTGLLVFSGTAGIQFTGTGQIDMGTNKIINLGNPTLNQDAATKSYTDSQDALHVLKTGDTMSGVLDMGGFKITNLANATLATDALNRQTGDTRYLQLTGGTLTGTLIFSAATINMGLNQIKNMADPTLAQDAATKFYVDSVAGPGSDTYVSSFTYSGGLASSSTLNLTQTGPNAGVPFNINMGHLHSTDDDQYLVPPNSDLDLYYRLFGVSGYQRVTFTVFKTNATNTGLTNPNTYTASITVDGGAPIAISISPPAGPYLFSDLVNDLNSQLGGFAVARLVDNDTWLTIQSKSMGLTSTILITDTNLFSSITNFSAITAAVPGYGSSLVTGYPTIDLTTTLLGIDTVHAKLRPSEVIPAFTINPRSTPVTPVSNVSGPTVSGAAQLLVNIPIITADSGTSKFTVEGGDFTTGLTPGLRFEINDSFIGNNGTYTILSTSFDDSNKVTTITVVETIPFSTVAGTPDGTISYSFVPVNDDDLVTKFWIDRLVARDVISADGMATQYTLGHSLTVAGFDTGFGFQEVAFSKTGSEIDITGATLTGLSGVTTYTATVFVDGTPHAISFLGVATFTLLVAAINAALPSAETELVNGRLRISSKFAGGGAGSTIVIVDGNTNPLFASLLNVTTAPTFDAFVYTISQPGLEYTKGLNRLWVYVNGMKQFVDDDYTEDGVYGENQSTVTFTYTPGLGARIEFLVFRT